MKMRKRFGPVDVVIKMYVNETKIEGSLGPITLFYHSIPRTMIAELAFEEGRELALYSLRELYDAVAAEPSGICSQTP